MNRLSQVKYPASCFTNTYSYYINMNTSTFASINNTLHVTTSSEAIGKNTGPKCRLK